MIEDIRARRRHLHRPFCALIRFPALLAVASLVAACIPSQIESSRSEAFKQYETLVRWSQWDAAADFIAPEYLVEHPITPLDMERLRLFRVTQYIIRSTQVVDEGMTAYQVVEIRLFNNTQAVEKAITDEQVWRYSEERQRWQLHSSLPDPTKAK